MQSVPKQNLSNINTTAAFLLGAGEMGKLILEYDWASTSVGAIGQWPQSLKTTLGILVHSKFPMFLFWGGELICFYNDAYRPSLGNDGKHPSALGKPGAQVWPEIWPVIKPLIDQVLAGGEATWSEDQLIPIFRNGQMEDVYWTFSYSPVIDESGKPGGVFVTCSETTRTVQMVEAFQVSERRFQNLVREATVGIIVLSGDELKVEIANEAYGRLIDRTPDALLSKNIFDVVPEAEETFRPIIDKVRKTGEPIYLYDYPYQYYIDGETRGGFVNLIYQPYRETDGTISGVMILCQDVSSQVRDKHKILESEHLLKKVIEESPIRISLLTGPEMRIEMVNDTILKSWQKTKEEVLGRPIKEVLPEMDDQPYFDILDQVYKTGIPYSGKESEVKMFQNGKWATFYFDYWYRPILNADEKVYAILGTSIDVTEKVIAQKARTENEHRFKEVVESAPFPIAVYTGDELTILLANQAILDTWGKGNDVVGKTYIETLPELDEEIYGQVRGVMKTGIPFHAKNTRVDLVIQGELQPFYFNYSFTPLFDSQGKVYGVMNTAADVTDVNIANQKAEQSRNNLRNTILQAPVAMCILKGPKHFVDIANERMLELWGKTADEIVGGDLMDGLHEIKGQGFDLLLDHVYATGQTYRAYDVAVNLPRQKGLETVYVDFVYEAFRDGDGTIHGVIVVATDVTEQVIARQKTEQAEESARLAIESGDLGKYEVNLMTNEIKVSDRFNQIWGVELTLPRPEYATYIHPQDGAIRLAAHTEAMETGNLHYEARVVWDDQSVHWIRVKGKVIFDDMGQPITLLGVVQDINDQKLFAEELQKQVRERTAELHRSNEDLLHFAHVASHDLKEPIRKIKVFGNMLADEFASLLPERGLNHLKKIQNATDRMFAMIDGVLSYSTINAGEQPIEKVDLNKILDDIETDLEIVIQKKNAVIKRSPLPIIEGASVLLYQLFYNLINNALKFSKADRPPLIAYYHSIISNDGVDYMEITIADNGIGLEQQYAEQIFNAFSRLHGKDQYEGTGLGLALCKKIVERHHGTITATGVRDEGAVFTIMLPVKQRHRKL
jgi:PAS domain S-box-containing protein